jgi:hypothetical protein
VSTNRLKNHKWVGGEGTSKARGMGWMMQAMVPAILVHCSMGNAILLSAYGIVIARTEVPLLLTTYRGLSKYYQAHLITDLEAKDDNQISQAKKGGQKGWVSHHHPLKSIQSHQPPISSKMGFIIY